MFTTVVVDDLDLFERTLYHLKNFIFRGQCNSEWQLQPQLDRLLMNYNKTSFSKTAIEKLMVEKCQKNIHLYTDLYPENDDYYSWFSLVQHYGGPTRLLDFSYSPYIALFFALDSRENYKSAALWCLNRSYLWQKEAEYFEMQFPDKWFGNYRYITTQIFNERIFDNNAKRMNSIILLDQKINHQRIALQQGTFLASLDNLSEFSDCLYRFLGVEKESEIKIHAMDINSIKQFGIIKFVIDKKYYTKLLYKLKMMNLSSTSLFPGLEGFIKSFFQDIYIEE